MKMKMYSMLTGLVLLTIAAITFGCSSKATKFKAGQKLVGRYERTNTGSKESYIFKDDGTFQHTGFANNEGTEQGTYRIDGETITFDVGGKTVTMDIYVPKGDADKQTPAELSLDFNGYRNRENTNLTDKGNTNSTEPQSTVRISKEYPPSPEFEKFFVVNTGKFTMESASSFEEKVRDYLKGVRYSYKYTDKRNAALHGEYGVDAHMDIREYGTPEEAQKRLKKRIAETIPLEKADSVKLPKCVGEKSESDEFEGPEKLVKTLKHPNGSDIYILRSGDFNMYDCKRGSSGYEYAVWADGSNYFVVETTGFSGVKDGQPNATGFERAEEFAVDYLNALKQKNPN